MFIQANQLHFIKSFAVMLCCFVLALVKTNAALAAEQARLVDVQRYVAMANVCEEAAHVPSFQSFFNLTQPLEGSTYIRVSRAKAKGPDRYQFSVNGENRIAFLAPVNVSSWTCPPDGDSRKVSKWVYYLLVYEVNEEENLLIPTGEFFELLPLENKINSERVYSLAEISNWKTYDKFIGDNIGVEILVYLPNDNEAIAFSSDSQEEVKYLQGCISKEVGSETSPALIKYIQEKFKEKS